LLVTVDAEAKLALGLLNSVGGVASVEVISLPESQSITSQSAPQEPRYDYALNLGDGDNPMDAAPIVASLIAKQGWKLYKLHAEHRNLEQIFSEVSAQGGR
jgi:hypothetical protein